MKKFYSYSNDNGDYTKAISLTNVRSVRTDVFKSSKNPFRYLITITYTDQTEEVFSDLAEDEMKEVYKQIVNYLNID